MKNRSCFLGAAIAVGLAFLSTLPSLAADPQPSSVSGFVSPETVIHDPLTDVYLVSNVGGPPVTVNHGFISRVSRDGNIQDLRWIQDGVNGVTLHGPKGLWASLTGSPARRFVIFQYPIRSPLRVPHRRWERLARSS
jgi:hypothetical protein